MGRKLNRVLDEIQKTEEKICAWQEHLRELNILREQLENQEIIKSVRSLKLDSRRMLELLEGIQSGSILLGDIGEVDTCDDTRNGMDAEMPETAGGKQVPMNQASEGEDKDEEI